MNISSLEQNLQTYLQDSFPSMLVSEQQAQDERDYVTIQRHFTLDNHTINMAHDEFEILAGLSLEICDVFATIFADNDICSFTGFKVIQKSPSPSQQTFGIEFEIQTQVKQ
ncbi:hypothetical protein PP175_25880 (plasmid) [Aneurinibacillus sp. Ricciae_BoGa-3]|uniref:hypothetical protein n=1 Tax=Aneurinibacillus sp. Ricciae_BoGa-3 TaxID=3022697 RepID=UPI0023416C8C|nr:hypothetical protein [Aneurinibacillus sp. Ricciae_BoGa-3]WCK57499.1 hypothetical protein PP175_25880 [Aneurinibacillus sp. Ricciae_BoGa-3]